MAEHSPQVMPDRISVRGLAFGGLIVAACIAIALIGAYLLLHVAGPAPRLAEGVRPAPRIAGDVRLQVDPARDIGAFTAQKRRLIESYGWVDRERGIARIPVERAMAILASGSDAARGRP